MSKFRTLILVLSFLLPVWVLAGPIDINTADAKTLAEALKGMGPAKAEAVIAYREKHGPFKSVEDLVLVQGIGEKTLEINRDNVTVGTPTVQ
jgi:competence protein ComEA